MTAPQLLPANSTTRPTLDRIHEPSISFIVPALNEEPLIENTVLEILKTMEERSWNFEVLLIDDGSSDATGPIMERLAAQDKRIRYFHHPHNQGLGAGYKTGVQSARYEYLMWVPSENAIPAESLIRLTSRIGEADIIIPHIRNRHDRPLYRRFLTWGYTTLLNLLFGLRLEFYTGPVIHRTKALREITIATNGFAYQPEALIKLLKRRHTYVQDGYVSIERKGGRSALLRLKSILGVLGTVFSLYREMRRCSNPRTRPSEKDGDRNRRPF